MSSLPSHLFASSCDGSLYDTRSPEWSKNPPLRAVYNAAPSKIATCAQLKAALRHGPYAWPGGYPLYFHTDDGAALSFEAVRDNLRLCLAAIQERSRDGWRVVGVAVNWEDSDLTCEQTGERIESAYAEPD
jgi:hypothetical protein